MNALRFLPVLLVLAACDTARDDPFGALSLTADAPPYAVGADVGLTLRNGSAREVGTTGLYCARLERQTASGWELSPDGNRRGCATVVTPVPAGEDLAVRVPLDGVGAGTYRFTQRVGVEGVADGVTLATAPFEVR